MKKILTFLALFTIFCCPLKSDEPKPLAPFEETFSDEHDVLLSGNANLPLAREMASLLHISLAKSIVKRFNDGEIQIQIDHDLRNKNVFLVQPTCSTEQASVNDNLMELYLLVRTIKREGAHRITAIIPYYGYARQDRKSSRNSPISAADVALLLEMAGIDHIIALELHCGQIQGFFHNIAVDNLHASATFAKYFARKDLKNVVVVSPDAGGVERAHEFREALTKMGIPAGLAVISKHRPQAGVIDSMQLIGEVMDADAIIVDDLCDTGGTLVKAAALLKENGAHRVFASITHAVFSNNALEKIQTSLIDEMVVSNSLPMKKNLPPNIRSLSIAPLLVEKIGQEIASRKGL